MACCKKVFVLPTFNLSVNIWRNTNATSNPPDVISTCQLRFPDGVDVQVSAMGTVQVLMLLLLPSGTDIRSWVQGSPFPEQDTVECPAGSGRFYTVAFIDDAAKGFANEHRIALIAQQASWPTPMP